MKAASVNLAVLALAVTVIVLASNKFTAVLGGVALGIWLNATQNLLADRYLRGGSK
jgi:hypothetical protein